MPRILGNATPLSLVGRSIATVLPDANARVVQTQPQTSGGAVTSYDTDGDGAADVRVSRGADGGVHNVDVIEDGRSTLLWNNGANRIHWVQQSSPGGRFENVMDDDHDGLADRLARGVTGGAVEIFRLQQGRMPADRNVGAVDVGVPSSMLSMPHAALSPEHLTLTWHADIEKADIDLFVPFSSLTGPTLDTRAIVGASPVSSWAGTKQTVTVETDGIRLRIENTDGAAWMNKAPTLALELADGSKTPLAVFAPKILVDDRAPDLVGLRSSLDSARTLRGLLKNQLEEMQEKLRLPERHLGAYVELTKLQTEHDSVETTIDSSRPAVRAAFVANITGLGELAVNTAVPVEKQRVFAEALALAQSAADGEPVADYLEARDLLDEALAYSTSDVAFANAVDRLFQLDTYDIPRAESDVVIERNALVTHAHSRIGDLERQIALHDDSVVTWGRRLTALPGRAPEQRGTTHEPYTF